VVASRDEETMERRHNGTGCEQGCNEATIKRRSNDKEKRRGEKRRDTCLGIHTTLRDKPCLLPAVNVRAHNPGPLARVEDGEEGVHGAEGVPAAVEDVIN
jgi:hypothetical protein